MNEKPTYRKWVGVVLSLLLHGSAHFLSGKRAAGLKWYFGLFACGLLGSILIAIPGNVTLTLGAVFWLSGIVLWLIMLKQSYRSVKRIGFLGWLAVVGLSVIMNVGLKLSARHIVHPFTMPMKSMAPTIMPGDQLFVQRLAYLFARPQRGDIVVFRTKGIEGLPAKTFYIKRIVGLPGERIRIEPPNLIVNDHPVTEPAIFTTISKASDGYAGFTLAAYATPLGAFLSKPTDEVTLGPDEYCVLGDNTRNSRDSRYWGAVPERSIIGKATRIYWPFTRINALEGN